MSEYRARDVAVLLASVRTAIGLTFLVAPSLAKLWVGASGRSPGGRALSRSLAAREVVLGCGTLLAISDPSRLRGWLAAGAFCDGVDALTSACTAELPCFSRGTCHAEFRRGGHCRRSGGAVAAGLRPG